jgi:hypothetical protein
MITKTKITHFTKSVHENGKKLEKRVEDFLNASHIQYIGGKNNGIDFIINGDIHLDCVAQGISGSIGDKVPTKCFKYIKKYGLKDIYILHPYSPITQVVAEHLEFLEKGMDCNIHIIDWNDFMYLMGGSKFEKRKAYNFVKNSAQITNSKANVLTIKKYFEFNK